MECCQPLVALLPAGVAGLVSLLSPPTCPLQTLNISSNCIPDDEVIQLAAAIEHSTTLVRLSLQRNWIGDEGAKALAELLQHHISLTHLLLDHNRVKNVGMEALLDAVLYNGRVMELGTEGNRVMSHLVRTTAGDVQRALAERRRSGPTRGTSRGGSRCVSPRGSCGTSSGGGGEVAGGKGPGGEGGEGRGPAAKVARVELAGSAPIAAAMTAVAVAAAAGKGMEVGKSWQGEDGEGTQQQQQQQEFWDMMNDEVAAGQQMSSAVVLSAAAAAVAAAAVGAAAAEQGASSSVLVDTGAAGQPSSSSPATAADDDDSSQPSSTSAAAAAVADICNDEEAEPGGLGAVGSFHFAAGAGAGPRSTESHRSFESDSSGQGPSHSSQTHCDMEGVEESGRAAPEGAASAAAAAANLAVHEHLRARLGFHATKSISFEGWGADEGMGCFAAAAGEAGVSAFGGVLGEIASISGGQVPDMVFTQPSLSHWMSEDEFLVALGAAGKRGSLRGCHSSDGGMRAVCGSTGSGFGSMIGGSRSSRSGRSSYSGSACSSSSMSGWAVSPPGRNLSPARLGSGSWGGGLPRSGSGSLAGELGRIGSSGSLGGGGSETGSMDGGGLKGGGSVVRVVGSGHGAVVAVALGRRGSRGGSSGGEGGRGSGGASRLRHGTQVTDPAAAFGSFSSPPAPSGADAAAKPSPVTAAAGGRSAEELVFPSLKCTDMEGSVELPSGALQLPNGLTLMPSVTPEPEGIVVSPRNQQQQGTPGQQGKGGRGGFGRGRGALGDIKAGRGDMGTDLRSAASLEDEGYFDAVDL